MSKVTVVVEEYEFRQPAVTDVLDQGQLELLGESRFHHGLICKLGNVVHSLMADGCYSPSHAVKDILRIMEELEESAPVMSNFTRS